MHEELQHVIDSEHQSPQTADRRQIAGTPVFTADQQRVGAIERVMSLSESTGERFLVVNPGAMRRRIGTDVLYIPETQVHTSHDDRLILETPLAALPAGEWSELPTDPGRD